MVDNGQLQIDLLKCPLGRVKKISAWIEALDKPLHRVEVLGFLELQRASWGRFPEPDQFGWTAVELMVVTAEAAITAQGDDVSS